MAEIKIEKKKGIPVWAILLGLILLALLVWAYLRMRGGDQQDVPRDLAVLEWRAPVVSSLAPTRVLSPSWKRAVPDWRFL